MSAGRRRLPRTLYTHMPQVEKQRVHAATACVDTRIRAACADQGTIGVHSRLLVVGLLCARVLTRSSTTSAATSRVEVSSLTKKKNFGGDLSPHERRRREVLWDYGDRYWEQHERALVSLPPVFAGAMFADGQLHEPAPSPPSSPPEGPEGARGSSRERFREVGGGHGGGRRR